MNAPADAAAAILLPHVFGPVLMLMMILLLSWKAGRWPSERLVIELLGHSAGLYAAWVLVFEGAVATDSHEHIPWMQVMGGLVLGFATFRSCIRALARFVRASRKLKPTASRQTHETSGRHS